MLTPKEKSRYWNGNLDPQNLGKLTRSIELEREIRFYLSPEQNWVYRQLGNLEGKLVLELGGGIGINAIIMARKGARVIVLDLSWQRLRLLQQLVRKAGCADRIFPLCGCAEALPLKNGLLDLAYTKAVLIHTDLPKALQELKRTLRAGGTIALVEPLRGHPLIELYRLTLAPKQWKSLTTYFNDDSIATVGQAFPNLQTRRYYLFGVLAFFWQYGLRVFPFFHLSVLLLNFVDQLLFKLLPFTRRLAWFTTLLAHKP